RWPPGSPPRPPAWCRPSNGRPPGWASSGWSCGRSTRRPPRATTWPREGWPSGDDVPGRSLLAWLHDPSPTRGIRFLRGDRWDLLTYDRLAALVGRAARGLVETGATEDRRVALVLPSGPEFAASFFWPLLSRG